MPLIKGTETIELEGAFTNDAEDLVLFGETGVEISLLGGDDKLDLSDTSNVTVIGNAGDDLIDATDSQGTGNTLIGDDSPPRGQPLGAVGNDILIGNKEDILEGGRGSDILIGGTGGNNQLLGGSGGDRFVIAAQDFPDRPSQEIPSTANIIKDFNFADDRISISLSEIDENDFGGDLTIVDDGGNAVISANDGTGTFRELAIVEGVAAADLLADISVFEFPIGSDTLDPLNAVPVVITDNFNIADTANINQGDLVGTIVVFDDDETDLTNLTVEITAGNDSNDGDEILPFELVTTADSVQLRVLDADEVAAADNFSLTVTATDQTPLTGSGTIGVGVNVPLNLAPTAVALQGTLPNDEINENTEITPDFKIADINITDPDNLGTNDLSLSGADASLFTITGTELFLNVGTEIDFETKSAYNITVNVDDTTLGFTPDASVDFTLAVNDINEAPTVEDDTFDANNPGNLQNDQVIRTLQIDDQDAKDTIDTLTIEIVETGIPFDLVVDTNTNTVQLVVTDAAAITNAQATTQSFSFTVRATDSGDIGAPGQNPLQGEGTIEVFIDAPTVLPATFTQDENTLVNPVAQGTVVGNLDISDPQTAVADLVVEIAENVDTSTSNDVPFAVAFDQGTSVWQVLVDDPSQLDFETTPTYDITVTATDADDKTSQETITIDINDIDPEPTFDLDLVDTITGLGISDSLLVVLFALDPVAGLNVQDLTGLVPNPTQEIADAITTNLQNSQSLLEPLDRTAGLGISDALLTVLFALDPAAGLNVQDLTGLVPNPTQPIADAITNDLRALSSSS